MVLREAFLPTLQGLFLLDAIFYPCRFSCRKLPFSPTKLDFVSQLSFTAVAGSAICISNELYKGESSGGGFNARCRATSLRPN